MIEKVRVWSAGFVDGFKQKTLRCGRTWVGRPDLNEIYDRGANLGEKVRSWI